MANSADLDFECPQFVDFAAELNKSDKDDLFFDCKEHQSPELASVSNPTSTIVKDKCPTVEEEDRLLNKMAAALSIIENTPKLNQCKVRGQQLTEKFPTTVCSKPYALKANTVPAPAVRLLRSKSIAHLNKIITENTDKSKEKRKRSSSLNDLRPCKKQTYPMTPMCLKRTIKAKNKIVKTTEEIELEEIAKLQEELKQHLRYNELHLKRLKLKSKPCTKNTHVKTEDLKGNKNLNPFVESAKTTKKEVRQPIHTLNHTAMKMKAIKNNIIKGQPAAHKTGDEGLTVKNPKNPSLSSLCAAVNDGNKIKVPKKPMTKKYGFHSGLQFHDNVRKSTTVKFFNFDGRIQENVKNTETEQKAEVSVVDSKLKSKLGEDKENNVHNRSQSIATAKENHNINCDIAKQLASSKRILQKRFTNQVRGLPLSENFARK